jgi:hypothetical protein
MRIFPKKLLAPKEGGHKKPPPFKAGVQNKTIKVKTKTAKKKVRQRKKVSS